MPVIDSRAIRHMNAGWGGQSNAGRILNSITILLNAVAIAQRFNISFWDASILAAASSLGSKTLYPEDLNNGQKYDSVLVVNPFETGLST